LTAEWDCLEALRALGHELRRPLTVVRGAATLLVEDGERLPEASRRQMMALVERGVDTMSEMVDDLLTAVHLDVGDLELMLEPLDVSALVAEVVAMARRREPERAIEVRDPGGVVAVADREQAARALRVVLANAILYSPPDQPVEVVIEPGPARLGVLDRGPGIPSGQREQAFARFVRLDPGTGGAGLGLYLARGLARAMGGDVAVEDRDGGGCAAWITLSRRA
jgi:signal transduction histidine kinase